MASSAEDHIQDLCEEVVCPICLDYLKKPVTIECGHNFCHDCLSQFWGELEKEATCPECRVTIQQKTINPNWQLARFVEITQKLSSHTGRRKEEGTRGMCEKHQEPLKLFCKDDESPICVVCDRAKEHKNHQVMPVEEAAQEYKDLICSSLDLLKKKREKLLAYKSETEQESQDLLKQKGEALEKTRAEFRQLFQFLEKQEKHLLTQMEEVEKEVLKKRDEHLDMLSSNISSLESLIQEIEEKQQQPASDLLQEVKTILQRSEENASIQIPMAFPVELQWKLWDISDINLFLVNVMKQFKGALLTGLQLNKANITLDPDTAHPRLILSEDCKSVTKGEKYQDLPDNPERFKRRTSVLGCERFTEGRHFWEISVGKEEEWITGITRQSVKRKAKIMFGPEEGIWAVGKWEGQHRATNHPHYPPVSPDRELNRIRVSLNYPGGQVAFHDAETGIHLHTFSEAQFMGETLLPFFHVYKKGYLRIPP